MMRTFAASEPGCFRCHGDKRGPFTFEHAPVRAGDSRDVQARTRQPDHVAEHDQADVGGVFHLREVDEDLAIGLREQLALELETNGYDGIVNGELQPA